jgi:hypothetical protein
LIAARPAEEQVRFAKPEPCVGLLSFILTNTLVGYIERARTVCRLDSLPNLGS